MSYRRGRSGYEGQIAGLYDLGVTLGKGHYAVVKAARHVFTGEKVAVKVIDKLKLDDISRAHLFQEVRCMKLVQHQNVVRLYEVIDTQTKLYLVLELGDGGDLYDYIMQHAPGCSPQNRCPEVLSSGDKHAAGGLDELTAARHFYQIASAVEYCHRLRIVHRDIKPENCLFVNGKETLKLTDFGFSNKFTPGRMLRTSCGSLAYSSPEILLGDEYDPPAVDVWSCGVILFMLVTGVTPFQDATDGETLIRIMDCKYTIPPHVSALCSDLIRRMLRHNPRERPTLEEVLTHPWVQAGAPLDPPDSTDPSPPTDATTPLKFLSPRTPSSLVRSVPSSPGTASPRSAGLATTPGSGRPGAPSCRENLTSIDHCFIVQRIVDGKIATRDQILQSLERSAYNHITATYDLLAEQILRKRAKAALVSIDSNKTPGGTSPISPLALNGPLYGPIVSNDASAVTNSVSDMTSLNNSCTAAPQKINLTNAMSNLSSNSNNGLDMNGKVEVVDGQSGQTVKRSSLQRPASLDVSGKERRGQRSKRCSLIKEIDEEENDGGDEGDNPSQPVVESGKKIICPSVPCQPAGKTRPGASVTIVTKASNNPSSVSVVNPTVSSLPVSNHVRDAAGGTAGSGVVDASRSGSNQPRLRLVMPGVSQVKFAVPEPELEELSETGASPASKVSERSLRKVASSPQLQLNQICEDEEEEDDGYDGGFSPPNLPATHFNAQSGNSKVVGDTDMSANRINTVNTVKKSSSRSSIGDKELSSGSTATKHRVSATARDYGVSTARLSNGTTDSKEIEAFINRVKESGCYGTSARSQNPGTDYKTGYTNKDAQNLDNGQSYDNSQSYDMYDYNSFMPEELRTRSLNRRSNEMTSQKPPLSSRTLESRSVRLRDLSGVVSDTESSEPYENRYRVTDRNRLRRFSIGERRGVSRASPDSNGSADADVVRRLSVSSVADRRLTSWNSHQDLVRGSSDDRELSGEGLHSHYTFGCSLASELRQQRNEGMAEVERHREMVNTARRKSKGTIRFRSKEFGSLVDKFKTPSAGDVEGAMGDYVDTKQSIDSKNNLSSR